MPRVPVVEGPSVREQPVGPTYRSTPDVSSGIGALSRAAGQVADVAFQVAEREDHAVALQTEADIKTSWAKYDADLRKASQGLNAKGYAAKVNEWWAEQAKTAGAALTPAQRALVSRSLAAAQTQAFQSATAYEAGEIDRADSDAFNAAQLAEVQRAAASGDPAVAATSSQLLRERNAQRAAAKGWSPEQLADANMRATTALHANVIQQIQQADPTAAMAYFNANKGEIDGTRHAEIGRALTVAVAANDGEKAATKLWGEMGPKGYNDPVLLDKMEERVRELYPNDAERRKAAISALRERVTAHNQAQAESNAAAVNQVMAVYNSTKSLAAMKRDPAWAAMPPSKQAEVENHIVAMQTAVLGRDEAAAQREQRRLQREGFGAYLVYSDPTVLAGMSDAQVQALLPVLGNDLTNHLMEKKRSTKTPAGEAEAKMDKQDFDHVADQMGLKPFAKKTDEEKARLGELQFRVEQMVYQAQREKGKPLTREEKMGLMRNEMARTVKVSSWFGLSSDDKPVIGLAKDDVAKVVIPAADRQQLTAAMQTMFDRTKSPAYAPTEDNLRRFYLLSKSRAARIVAPEPAGE